MLNEGRVVACPQLVAGVWGGRQVGSDALKYHMRRLRQKLAGSASGRIVNCRGVGYRIEE
jgi:DNA-binding response OmpR family regulator